MSEEEFSCFLLQLYAAGVVEFRTWLSPVAREPGARPLVHPLARWQAGQGPWVASLFHMPVKIEDELGRSLLGALDGTLDRAALNDFVWKFLESRNALERGASSESAVRQNLEAKLEENLRKLARLGLLVEPTAMPAREPTPAAN